MTKLKICAFCKKRQSKGKLSRFEICDPCKKNNYLTQDEAAAELGYSKKSAYILMTDVPRDTNKMPNEDIKAGRSRFWKAETIDEFINGSGLIYSEVQALSDLNLTRKEMADILKVDVKKVNVFCRANKITAHYKVVPTKMRSMPSKNTKPHSTMCVICNKNTASKHIIRRSHICEECNNQDYLEAKEVCKIVGVTVQQATIFIQELRSDVFPMPDLKVGIWMNLWKRESVKVFMRDLPKFDKSKAIKMYSEGVGISGIAKHMDVDRALIYRLLKVTNNLNYNKRYRPDEYKKITTQSKYNHAMQLFNQCRINP